MPQYLSNDGYIERNGEAETKRLTDETRSDMVDSAKLEEALVDASAEVDSYISKRYVTPLATVPRLVQSWVSAIAREMLHKSKAPQAVVDEAARARAHLKDVSRGLASIAGLDGIVIDSTTGVGMSETSGDGSAPVFTDCSMAGFGVSPQSDVARWRQ